MKIAVHNQKAEKVSELELSDVVFAVKPKSSVVHQVFLAMRGNARKPWADTKDRGEVSGGGKKPWKQKGTGRARHGSIRSPIWKGGGVTFGPLSIRNYKQKINQKVKRLATRMCLSDKVLDNRLFVLANLPSDGKTKAMAELFNKFKLTNRSVLFLADKTDEKISRAMQNLPRLEHAMTQDVNVVDLLNHQYLVVTESAVKHLDKKLNPELD